MYHFVEWYIVPIVKNTQNHWCTNRHSTILSNGTLYQSSKTVKNNQKTVKTAKMTIGIPIVTGLPRLYQQCTNSVPIVKNSQKRSKDSQNSKNDYWCTNRHMSTKTVPTMYQSSKTVKRQSKQQK